MQVSYLCLLKSKSLSNAYTYPKISSGIWYAVCPKTRKAAKLYWQCPHTSCMPLLHTFGTCHPTKPSRHMFKCLPRSVKKSIFTGRQLRTSLVRSGLPPRLSVSQRDDEDSVTSVSDFKYLCILQTDRKTKVWLQHGLTLLWHRLFLQFCVRIWAWEEHYFKSYSPKLM